MPPNRWQLCSRETWARHSPAAGIEGGPGSVNEGRVDSDHPDPCPQSTNPRTVGFGSAARHQRRSPSPPAQYASAEENTRSEGAKRQTYGMVHEKRDAPDWRTERSSTAPARPYAATGTNPLAAKTNLHATYTNAQVAEKHLTVRRAAVSQRRLKPKTPLVADRWENDLLSTRLHTEYPQIPQFIRCGAIAGIPQILHLFTPPNKESTEALSDVFNDIIQSEFNKGRYLGPFSQEELEREIGPFQSSPLSLVLKSGKPGKYRLIQNLSYPHTNLPTPSINSYLNSDDFPCTWGTFRTVCTLIHNLPRGSQAAVRDIAEAYRIIPLHESQWAGVVVRISNQPKQFALNTCNSFGGTTAGGLFGLFGDALADLLRARGIGPILKWVDDFIFFRIPRNMVAAYNEEREQNRKVILENGGKLQTGGRIWYKGKILAETGAEQFAENLAFPIRHARDHPNSDTIYGYGFDEIDELTKPLGIPWEASKDIHFSHVVPFVGFAWDLERKRVALPESKKEKYIQAISEWRKHTTHTLDDVRKLYGKLLYACLIVPRGRAYLTNLEKMMGTFNERPFSPRHPPEHVAADLTWWETTLAQPSLSREIPGGRQITDVRGYSDASSTVGIGIVIGDKWRAWRLIPGWKAGGRDIGWAEAVGMELLIRTILRLDTFQGIRIFGDNTGVVEGWWTGRSRNAETNRIFRRIHELLDASDTILTTKYVDTNENPADGPSRGIYPPRELLLPPIDLPDEIKPFVIDFNAPLQPREKASPRRPPPAPKAILPHTERHRRQQANTKAAEQPDETP